MAIGEVKVKKAYKVMVQGISARDRQRRNKERAKSLSSTKKPKSNIHKQKHEYLRPIFPQMESGVDHRDQ